MNEKQTFTEAPASINLRFDYRGARGVQLTLRAQTGAALLTKLDDVFDTLDRMGATFGNAGNGAQAQGIAPANAPTCPAHGTPMKASQHKQGEWYCPQKIAESGGGADGSRPVYCNAKVKIK